MPKLDVRDLKNKKLKTVELPDAVFGAPMKQHLVFEAVHHYRAAARSGTAATKGRGEVQGSGRKLWRQKKTGRARMGSVRSPLWRTGGTVHGPKPRSYDYNLPPKMRRGALRSVLSERIREGKLMMLDNLELPSHRTKEFVSVLGNLELKGQSVLVVDDRENRNVELAVRNLERVDYLAPLRVHAYDVLAHQYILITEAAVAKLQERLSA